MRQTDTILIALTVADAAGEGGGGAPLVPSSPQHKLVSVTALAVILVLLSALAAGLALALLSRYRRRVLGKPKGRGAARRSHTLDAWRESGRRVQGLPSGAGEPGSDDDTVDLDPDSSR